jgi:hypothetical protein
MVELLVQKNQQVKILIFTKVMAKKVQNFRSFFSKVAVVKKSVSKAQNKNQILNLHEILRRNGPIQFF